MSHHHNHDGHGHIHHHHGSAADFAAANQEHFTMNIADFEKPAFTELAREVTKVMREHFVFDKDATTVLDFACGAGHISRELGPYSKSIVGVDITTAAVDIYNKRAAEKGIPPEEMQGLSVELKGEEGELDGRKFDVVVCSMSYHHFGSVEDITKMLTFFLKPGGALLIVDILDKPRTVDQSNFPENFRHVVAHTSGFKEEKILAVFAGASLTTTTFVPEALEFTYEHIPNTLFFAKAVKPTSQL